MKLAVHAVALVLGFGFGLTASAAAEEEAATPAAEAAPAPEAEAAPAPAPASAKEVAPQPVAAASAPAPAAAPAKELSASAKSFVPLADSYKSAYDDMQKWIAEIDSKTAAVSDKAQKLQEQITANENAITQAKSAKENGKAKDLQKANKKLGDEFNASKKELATISSDYTKQASARVKQYADASGKALEGLKAQAK